jgi:hypothetical protein
MDYYYKEFEKLQKEFHEVMHDYPLFTETIEDIEEKDIKELNELLEKNDEFYLKKAISKLKDLISYVKNTSTSISNSYKKFDELAKHWEKIRLLNVSEAELSIINGKVKKANDLIKSHYPKDLIEANKILETLIKENE